MWITNSNFLNSGKTTAFLFHRTSNIHWKFKNYRAATFKYPFFECVMSGFGVEAVGFGIDINENVALLKSFSEAWERLVFMISPETVSSTNGFAAGETDEIALERSKNEVIERSILRYAWSNKVGWRKKEKSKALNFFELFAYRVIQWDISLYDIVSNIGVVKACLARHPKLGAVFDTSFSGRELADEKKSFLSVLKDIHAHTLRENFILPFIGNPIDHKYFYSDYKNIGAFDFLDQLSMNKDIIEMSDIDKLGSKLIYRANHLPAVAYAENKYWPKLTWGKQSIDGINAWPHPLA